MPRYPRCIPWLVVAICLILAGQAMAVAPEIRDEGKFFSPEAIKKANEQIRELYVKYGKDLLIETFPSVPADQRDKVMAMNGKEREEYFHQLAVTRATQQVVKGIYIRITRQPKFLNVESTPDSHELFDSEFKTQLRQTLLKGFRANEFDDGLAHALKTVQERLAKGASGQEPLK